MNRVLLVLPVLALALTGCSNGKPSAAVAPVSPGVAAETTPAPQPSTQVSPTGTSGAPAGTTPVTKPTKTPSKAPKPTKAKPGVPALKAQTITLADLPSGWSEHKVATGAAAKDGEPDCLKGHDKSAHKPTASVEVEFQGTPQGLPLLDESIDYAPKGAAADFASVTRVLNSCGTVRIQTGKTTLTGSLRPMSFPHLGDQSRAYQMVVSGTVGTVRVTVGLDLLLVRVGAEEMTLGYTTPGIPGSQDFEAAAKLVMNHLGATGTTA